MEEYIHDNYSINSLDAVALIKALSPDLIKLPHSVHERVARKVIDIFRDWDATGIYGRSNLTIFGRSSVNIWRTI